MAEEKKENWTCTPGWCGYVEDKGPDGNRPAEMPAQAKSADKEWECNAGWCGYVEKQEGDANRPADLKK